MDPSKRPQSDASVSTLGNWGYWEVPCFWSFTGSGEMLGRENLSVTGKYLYFPHFARKDDTCISKDSHLYPATSSVGSPCTWIHIGKPCKV